MKVFELSKELNTDSKQVLSVLSELGHEVKSHLSILDDKQVEEVIDAFSSIAGQKQDQEQEYKQEQKKATKPVQETDKRWKADLQRMICIRNISKGKLIYKSKRQVGYTIIWEKYGDTNYIELGEFINLKNSDSRFITEPWIRIIEDDEIEILKYANIYKHYQSIIEINDISAIFALDFNNFTRKFEKFPEGYKKMVVEQARQMISTGELDSIKIKKYLEERMETDLEINYEDIGKAKNNNYIELV